MRGRLVDAWKYIWPEIWEPLELFFEDPDGVYVDLFIQLERSLKVRLKTASAENQEAHATYFETSNDPIKARDFLKDIGAENLAGDPAIVMFFQNAYDVFNEYNEDIAKEFFQLLDEFISCHNLRYKLQNSPFQLQPHLPGVFASLFSEIANTTLQDNHLHGLMKDFEHSFYRVSVSHNAADMKRFIANACILAEGLGCQHPEAGKSSTLGALCGSIQCWPHSALQEAIKKVYGFCSDYPGIRHAGNPEGQLRELEIKDSIIVSLILLTASGYFLPWQDISEITGVNPDK